MGCQTTSKVLYQRIISTPDLLWRKIFHSINVAVSPAGELLLNNRWTLRKEQHWTMWYLTFKERTQVHSRKCQIGSEAALKRIAQLIIQALFHVLFYHYSNTMGQKWQNVVILAGSSSNEEYQTSHHGFEGDFLHQRATVRNIRVGGGIGHWRLGGLAWSAANPWWICCEWGKGLSGGGCQQRPNSSRVSKPASERSPGGSKVCSYLCNTRASVT